MIVLDAVMTLLGCEPTFAEAKKQLGEPRFLESVSFIPFEGILILLSIVG
jgi:hypothetical protein